MTLVRRWKRPGNAGLMGKEGDDATLKFRKVVQRVQNPSGQS
jgi:hypothetical protein